MIEMRYVADFHELSSTAFEKLPAAFVNWLITEVVAIDMNESMKHSIERELAQLNDPDLQKDLLFARRVSLLQRAKAGLVWSTRGKPSHATFTLEGEKPLIEAFEILQENCAALREELATLKAGQRRSQEYSRTIGVFPPLATKIHLSDPYAGKAVYDARRPNSNQAGRQWLLRKLLTDAPHSDITITTALVDEIDYTNFVKPQDRAERLFMQFGELVSEAPNYGGTFTLIVVRPDPTVFHDRFLQFTFDQGSFGLSLGKGVDDYMKDPLPKNITPAFVDGSAVALEHAYIKTLGVIFERSIPARMPRKLRE